MSAPAPLGTYLPFVKRIAGSIRAHVPPSIEVDDLIQEGFIGLMQAADKYEARGGVAFETFAAHRVRGAIIDSLRQLDWVPRGVRARAKDEKVEVLSMVSDDLFDEPASDENIVATLLTDELGRVLDGALHDLRERHRAVLELTYGEGMTLEGVAAMMGCDKSYVCRLRSDAVKAMAVKTAWYRGV